MARRVRAKRWRALLVLTLHQSPFAVELHPEEDSVGRKGKEQVQNVPSLALAKQCDSVGCLADAPRPLVPCPPHQPPPTTTLPGVCACVSWQLQSDRAKQQQKQLLLQEGEESGRPRRARQSRQLMSQATCACVHLSLTMHPAIVREQGLPSEFALVELNRLCDDLLSVLERQM